MGNQNSKGSTTTPGGTPPAWAAPGTDQYNNMNTMLQTAPMGVATQTFQQGGMGNTSQSVMGNLATGENFQNLYNKAGEPGAAQQYLSGTAGGEYLNGSPYLQDVINRTAQQQGDQVNQLFASGGRYGSGAHQGTLADSIGGMTSNLLNQNYQQERDRQMQAAGAISGEQQGRMGLQQGAAQGQMQSQLGAAGLENQGFQNMLGMIGALPTIQGNKTYDANQQMQAGNMLDQRNQQQLNDLINQWTQGDMQDWSRLGGLLSAGTASAGNYGTKTGTSEQESSFGSSLGGLGGLLTGIAQLGGKTGFGLWSDARLKANIERVGITKHDLPLYEFNYIGDEQRYRGVMAQDVEQVMPEAVLEDHSGYKRVSYAMLGIEMELV